MDFNTKLIALVKNYKYLYDTGDPSYGDNTRKHEAWKEIGTELDAHEKECKKSWTLLREGYRRFLKKQIASENDPVLRKDVLTRKWTYEDDMSFLAPHLKRYRRSINNDINIEVIEPERHNVATPAAPDFNEQKRALLKRTRSPEVVSRRSCTHETHSNTLIKYLLDKTMKRDDIQKFFDGISSTVQSFPPRDKALAKARVFELISRMELEILDREYGIVSLQDTESPASDEMEVTESRNHLDITPSPEQCRLASGMIEPCSCEDGTGPQLDIKIEPEQILGLHIKQEI